MGQFKPMVKMETTEPSVILKLKKGGHVNMKKGGKAESGHKPMGKMDGGVMGALANTPALVGRPAVNAPVRAPVRPSMAKKRAMATPVMKKGGHAESKEMEKDLAQDKAMIKKAMKQHDAQEHKGGKGTELSLKKGGKTKKYATGGVVNGQGGYATGGVVKGQGGYKDGGIIKTYKGVGPYNTTLMHEAKPDRSPAKTGDVKLGNGGGYKKGGAAKKYADGGRVQDDGRPVKMPQGHKTPTPAVAISQLSGTFKKGGRVAPGNRKLQAANAAENAANMRESKTDTRLKYGPDTYQGQKIPAMPVMKKRGGMAC